MFGMPIDQERSVWSIRTPAHSSKDERSFCQLRHGLTEELSTALSCFDRYLFLRKGNATSLAILFFNPIAIARVFVTHLQLVFVLVGLHKEALLDVKQYWKVFE